MSNINVTTTTKPKFKHNFLNQLDIYCVLAAQTVASAILIAFTLWLFLRLPVPQVHVTGFTVDALDKSNTSNRTLIHYNLTLHNPDLYKSINYDVLILRIVYSNYSSSRGTTVNFIVDGNTLHQSPRNTTFFTNNIVNYTGDSANWVPDDLIKLKTVKTNIKLRFVMSVRIMAFNRLVVGKRQLMQIARIYFDDDGKAFINAHGGLILR